MKGEVTMTMQRNWRMVLCTALALALVASGIGLEVEARLTGGQERN